MATSIFKRFPNHISQLDRGNLQCYNISGTKIVDFVKSANCPTGVCIVYTQSATDAPSSGSVSFTIICKPSTDGTYSRLYNFLNYNIYHAQWGSTIPTSITWYKMPKD